MNWLAVIVGALLGAGVGSLVGILVFKPKYKKRKFKADGVSFLPKEADMKDDRLTKIIERSQIEETKKRIMKGETEPKVTVNFDSKDYTLSKSIAILAQYGSDLCRIKGQANKYAFADVSDIDFCIYADTHNLRWIQKHMSSGREFAGYIQASKVRDILNYCDTATIAVYPTVDFDFELTAKAK